MPGQLERLDLRPRREVDALGDVGEALLAGERRRARPPSGSVDERRERLGLRDGVADQRLVDGDVARLDRRRERDTVWRR